MRRQIEFLMVVALATPATAPANCCADAGPKLEEITNRLAGSAEQKHCNLQEYSVTRHYSLRNERWHKDAERVVRISFRKGIGKTYQVIDEQGTEGVTKRVLDELIEAEVDASKPENPERGRLDSNNYKFTLAGTAMENGHLCYVLRLHPKTHSKFLIEGQAWVNADDFSLVKLEGRPSGSLGFWAGHPLITQEYEKVGGFWMVSYNHSLSKSHFLGKSELTIESTDYDIHTGQNLALRFWESPAVK